MTNRDILNKMMRKGKISQKEGWKFFDMLEPVEADDISGLWKGSELASGHPMDGMLAASGWYGKYFVPAGNEPVSFPGEGVLSDKENIYPLLFEKKSGGLFAANPGLLPLRLGERLPRWAVKKLFVLASPFIKTSKSGARMRMIKYRGKLTAAMIYDSKPVLDIFARVDEKTLLGVSDFKWEHDLGYFFILEWKGD